MNLKKYLVDFYHRLQTLFVKGLFVTLPIIATILIVNIIYRFLANWLRAVHYLEPKILQRIPGSEFIIATILLILVGIASKYLIIDPIVHYFERVVHKIPIISSIYSSAKKLVDFFNIPEDSNQKRQVVLIPFPNQSYYNIGFALGTASDQFSQTLNLNNKTNIEYIRIFLPTSPNPTTGFFMMIPKESIIYTSISFEDAIKTIVSCGLIQPDFQVNVQNQNANPSKVSDK